MQYAVSTQPQPSAPRCCTVFEIMAFIEARNHIEQHTCKWKVCVHVFACCMILAQSYRSFCLHGTGLLPSFSVFSHSVIVLFLFKAGVFWPLSVTISR